MDAVQGLKLWVDDDSPHIRPVPAGWTLATTLDQAMQAVMHCRTSDGHFSALSLDHDLGNDETTRPLVLYLAEHGFWPDIVFVHTMNGSGRDWLTGIINHYGPRVTPGTGHDLRDDFLKNIQEC